MTRASIMAASLLLSSGWATALTLNEGKTLTSSIEYAGGPKVVLTVERLTDSRPGTDSFPGPARLIGAEVIFKNRASVKIPQSQLAGIILTAFHDLRIDARSDKGDLEFSIRLQNPRKGIGRIDDDRVAFIIKDYKFSARHPELKVALNVPKKIAESGPRD